MSSQILIQSIWESHIPFNNMKHIVISIALAICFGTYAQDTQKSAFAKSYQYEYDADYSSAINELTAIYESTSYEINLRLGWLYYLHKDYLKSQLYYKKARDLKPQSIEAMFGYVYPIAALENWDEVIQVYTEILQLDPANYTANLRMANIFYYRRDFNRAITYAQVNGLNFPFDYATNLVLGQINIGLGKIDKAKAYLNKALLYYPESTDAADLLQSL